MLSKRSSRSLAAGDRPPHGSRSRGVTRTPARLERSRGKRGASPLLSATCRSHGCRTHAVRHTSYSPFVAAGRGDRGEPVDGVRPRADQRRSSVSARLCRRTGRRRGASRPACVGTYREMAHAMLVGQQRSSASTLDNGAGMRRHRRRDRSPLTSPDAEVFVGDERLEGGAAIDDVGRFRVHEHEERPPRMHLRERSMLPTTLVMKASRNGKLKKNTVSSLAGS